MIFTEVLAAVYGIQVCLYKTIKGKVINKYEVYTDTSGKKFFLKKYPQMIKSKVKLENINYILAVNNELIESGIITPKMIRTKDGSGGFIYNGNIYSLFEYIDIDSNCNEIDMHDAGLFLSKLHKVFLNIQMKGYDTWSPTVFDEQYNKNAFGQFNEYLFKRDSFLLAEKQYMEMKEEIDSYLINYHLYLNKVKKIQLIHGDLYPGNIIKVNGTMGIIDLDTMHYGNCIIDYAVMSTRYFVDTERNEEILINQYKKFKESYGSHWSASLVYESIIYELLSQIASMVINWRYMSRFNNCKRVMYYLCNRLKYFINSRDFFLNFL